MTGLKLTANSERRIGGIVNNQQKKINFCNRRQFLFFRFWTARLWQIATTAASFDEISKLALRVVRVAFGCVGVGGASDGDATHRPGLGVGYFFAGFSREGHLPHCTYLLPNVIETYYLVQSFDARQPA